MIETPQIWLTRMSPKSFQFWFSLDMVKDDCPSLPVSDNLVEILDLHVLSNDACQCGINLFPISWEPFENVNLLYFLLKMQIWNGCNARNIAGNPIKDINSKLTFLSSRSKVERWLTPQSDWAGCHLKFFISDLALTWWKMIDFSPQGSDIWGKSWKF